MDQATRVLIEAIHARKIPTVWAITGGGSSAATWLLSVPGASRSIMEVLVPYSQTALADFLGTTPEQACCASTAERLAERAWQRARQLMPQADTWLGVGCTATLVTDRPKRGEHRAFWTLWNECSMQSYSLILSKGARDRWGEEQVVARWLLNTVAEYLGLSERIEVGLLAGETVSGTSSSAAKANPWAEFLAGRWDWLCQEIDGQLRTTGATPRALLPGAFHPLHRGHLELSACVQRCWGIDVGFEISIQNVDKPELTASEVLRRMRQFVWKAPLWLTRAPTFVEKARLFRDCLMIVGADTARRLVAPRYYGDSLEQRDAALAELRQLGTRFVVGGRVDEQGQFLTGERIDVPPFVRDCFHYLDETDFRVDLSSTELRAKSC